MKPTNEPLSAPDLRRLLSRTDDAGLRRLLLVYLLSGHRQASIKQMRRHRKPTSLHGLKHCGVRKFRSTGWPT
ncbi:MAG: hypothetical protein JWQ17_5406 [Tardiphaga sp.]|jgi:hypothetical protein|nr:hypothetical protein [Tardiphaga sp.]